jgi:AcrR family transcriptional regulator
MTEQPELPRGIALAWGVAASPQRGPKREMSVERIVDAAIELADAEGLGAVSMAAVAARLGYTPMSLYRYVTAKDELTLLMQETALGPPPDHVNAGEDWRVRLAAFHSALLAAYLEHPWVLELPLATLTVTPNSAAWMDTGIAALAGTPLDDDARLSTALLVSGHARMAAAVVAEERRGEDFVGGGGSGPGVLASLVTADDYPDLRRALDAGVLESESDPFRFGLERILDGIGVHIDAISANGVTPLPEPVEDDGDVLADKRYREARRAVREAERALRAARAHARQTLREARERAGKRRS